MRYIAITSVNSDLNVKLLLPGVCQKRFQRKIAINRTLEIAIYTINRFYQTSVNSHSEKKIVSS